MNKKPNTEDVVTIRSGDVISEVRNWYYDRYATILAQRNLMILMIVLLIIGCILGILYIKEITLTRTIKPFVIQVEEKTGVTTVVDSTNVPQYMIRSESIKNYFLVLYLRARETYHPDNYQYQYDVVTRLLSSSRIYANFRRLINDKENSPITKYGNNTHTNIQIRSIQYNDAGNVATIRFRIIENDGQGQTFNKIATIGFMFADMTLSQEERFVNPVGFTVTSYRVDDEIYNGN